MFRGEIVTESASSPGLAPAGAVRAAAGTSGGVPPASSLQLLQEVSRELTSILDRDALLRRIAERVKALADYQLFALMLWNERTERLEHAFSLRFGEEVQIRQTLKLSEGLCGAAARQRQPVRVANVHTDARYVECQIGPGVRSELAVPLVVNDRLVGVLDLESTSYNAFTEEHEQMLSTLASYIAIALENARLYQELRDRQQRFERELDTARQAQVQILPPRVPCAAGVQLAVRYAPARELGGDFYDFPPYADGKIAFVAGDVSGKGTAAALHGMLAVGILREHVAEHPCPPEEMLELMNRRLHQPHIDDRFIAMLFGIYSPNSRALRMANGGFPRPLLVRNRRVENVDVSGLPLGILPETRYQPFEMRLEPGDVLAFCSDGIHETLNKREEEFGLPRLRGLLLELSHTGTAEQIADGLLEATARYSAGLGQAFDDRTVLILKV